MSNKRTDVLLSAITFSLTVFFFLPIAIYWPNREDILASDIFILRLLLFVSFGIFGAIALLLFLLRGKLRNYGLSLIAFMTTAVWMQSSVLNWDYGLLNGEDIPWRLLEWRGAVDVGAWLLIFIVIFYWGVLKHNSFRTLFSVLLFIQCCNLAYIFSIARAVDLESDRRIYISQAARADKFNFSTKNNIFVLILDGYPTDVFLESLETTTHLKETLTGFTYYPNALSGHLGTQVSVPLLMTGRCYTNQIPFNDFRREAHNNHSLVKLLRSQGYTAGVYSCYPSYYRHDLNIISSDEADSQDYEALCQISTVSLFRILPHALKKKVFMCFLSGNPYREDRERFLNEMALSARTTPSPPRLHWHHLKGLHGPWSVDNVQIKMQSRDSAMIIAHRLGNMLIDFLNTLKSMDVYDNSAILILSDHGWENVALKDNSMANTSEIVKQSDCFDGMTKINEKRVLGWSWQRALPMILIKPFNAKHILDVSCAPVSLSDIYPTILDLANNTTEEQLEGTSILQLAEETQRLRKYYMFPFAEARKRPKGYYPPMFEFEVNGFSWHEKDRAYTGNKYAQGKRERMPLDRYVLETPLSFGLAGSGMQYLDERWHSGDVYHFFEGNQAQITLLLENTSQDMLLQLDLIPLRITDRQKTQQVRFYVGDKLLSSVNLNKPSEVQVAIPTKHIVDNRLTLRIELSDARSCSPADAASLGLSSLTLKAME